jgi:hypothetical protein
MTYGIFTRVEGSEIEKTRNQQETYDNRSAKPIRVRVTFRPKWISTLSVLQNQRICYSEAPTTTHAMETLDKTRKPSTANVTVFEPLATRIVTLSDSSSYVTRKFLHC